VPQLSSPQNPFAKKASPQAPSLYQHHSKWVSLRDARNYAEDRELRPSTDAALQTSVPAEDSQALSREQSLSEISRRRAHEPSSDAYPVLTHRMPPAKDELPQQQQHDAALRALEHKMETERHWQDERRQAEEERHQAEEQRPSRDTSEQTDAGSGGSDGGGDSGGGGGRRALLLSNAWALLCADSLAAAFAALALVRLSPGKDGADDGAAAAAGPALWLSLARSWALGLVFLLVLDYLCGYSLPAGFPA
jgi:hypothetical protein